MKTKLLVTLLLVVSLPIFANPSAQGDRGDTALVDGSFTVGAGQYRFWTFDVYRSGARVRGRFRAEGGGRSDIECYIMDDDAFENFKTHHTVNTFYSSGRVTVATINVALGEGRYHLVFNNAYSLITPKAVSASVFIGPR